MQDLGIISPKWQHVASSFEYARTPLPAHNTDIHAELGDFKLYADPLLPRIFYNFLENSLRHWGSHLTEIRLFTLKEEVSLHLIYPDNGIGIPVEQKHQIFEFRQGSGTGMGMFLVREILGFTGITITENGNPGKCARFEIIGPKEKFRVKGRSILIRDPKRAHFFNPKPTVCAVVSSCAIIYGIL